MGKIGGALFGKPSKSVSRTPTGFQSLPGFAQGAFEEALTAGRGFLRDPSIFEPVPITSQQEQALATLALGAQPLTAQRFGQQLDVFQNPFIEQTLNPVLQDIDRAAQVVLGDIGSQVSQAGAFGGTRQAVLEAELGRNLAQERGRASANIRSQAFESAADRALSQLGSQQAGAAQLFNVGEILRSLAQEEKRAPIAASEFLATLAAGIPAGGGTVSRATGEQKGLISTLGGAALGNPAIGKAILGAFSDRNVKEDITFLRKEGEHNVYRFKYKNSPGYYEGVMAQEVQKIKPEAVGEYQGYLTVNYDMIKPELRKVA